METKDKSYKTTGAACEASGDGNPGAGEPMPPAFGQMGGEEGHHDISKQQANASAHGRPAVAAYPDNAGGSIESDNPTKGEGATGPTEYPHAGPPPGTTTI